MKNLFIAVLTFTLLISCGVEENTNQENTRSSSSCTIVNPNPFTVDVNTYGSYTNGCGLFGTPGLDCFPNKLRVFIHQEFSKGPRGLGLPTNYSFEIYNSFYKLGVLDVNLYLLPTIEPIYSNEIYRNVVCIIQDEINTLPTLPSNKYYYPVVNYCITDFAFNPKPTASSLQINYDITINPY